MNVQNINCFKTNRSFLVTKQPHLFVDNFILPNLEAPISSLEAQPYQNKNLQERTEIDKIPTVFDLLRKFSEH